MGGTYPLPFGFSSRYSALVPAQALPHPFDHFTLEQRPFFKYLLLVLPNYRELLRIALIITRDMSSKTVLSALLAAGVSLIPSASYSQKYPGCFMVAPNGQLIKLSSICGESDEVVLNTGLYQVPIKRRLEGIPIIDVTFNDQQTFEMMVDTGASSTVLTVEMAEALDLVPEGVMLVNTPSASGVSLFYHSCGFSRCRRCSGERSGGRCLPNS